MADIPYNLTSKDFGSYGDGLNGTIKMPIPSSYTDVSEIGIGWGTILGKLIGRAKGFGSIGTILRGGTSEIIFPTTFLNLPIVKIKIIAPKGYDFFDQVNIADSQDTGRSLIYGAKNTINIFDNRDSVWKGNRIIHDAWERRDSPLQMTVFKNKLWLYHNYEERVMPLRNLSKQYTWDARGEDLIFIWHAFGV